MDLSSAFSGLKGGSPQERKEALKQQIQSELAMANVSGWSPCFTEYKLEARLFLTRRR